MLAGLLISGAMVAVVAFSTLWSAHRQSLRVISQWKQPVGIWYNDGVVHYVSVYETDIDWRGFPFTTGRRYAVYAGRDRGEPSYGHTIDFTFYPGKGDDPLDTVSSIRKMKVVWSESGVTLNMTSGEDEVSSNSISSPVMSVILVQNRFDAERIHIGISGNCHRIQNPGR